MSGHCRLLADPDHPRVHALLRDAYRSARDFHGGPHGPGEPVANEVAIGAFAEGGRMLSCVRAVAIDAAHELSPHTELWSRLPPLLPSVFMRDAATASDHAGRGLNTLLRYHLLRAASGAGFASSCGLMTTRGTRARTLSEVGYAAFGETYCSEGLVARTGPWRLYVLDLSQTAALTRLRGLTAAVERAYPWRGGEIQWRRGRPPPPTATFDRPRT